MPLALEMILCSVFQCIMEEEDLYAPFQSSIEKKKFAPSGDLIAPDMMPSMSIRQLIQEMSRKLALGRDDRHEADIRGIWLILDAKSSDVPRSRRIGIQNGYTDLMRTLSWYSFTDSMSTSTRGLSRIEGNDYEKLKEENDANLSWIRPKRLALFDQTKKHHCQYLNGLMGRTQDIFRKLILSYVRHGQKHSPKHDSDRPDPDAQVFIQRYRRYIPNVPQTLHSITMKELKSVIHKLKNCGAAGLDNWNPTDFMALPDTILELLILFYDMCESHGKWPSALTWASVTLIPKG